MNVIIPCGGLGQRFTDAGYTDPKALILFDGKPIIHSVIESLVEAGDSLFIPYARKLESHGFERIVRNALPKGAEVTFIPINEQTGGAAETTALALPLLSDQPVLVADCDTWYRENIRRHLKGDCHLFWFDQKDTTPCYSYLQTEGERVTGLVEKCRVTTKANTGVYYWRRPQDAATDILKAAKSTELHESYMSLAIANAIAEGRQVRHTELTNDEVVCVGTPSQLLYHASKGTSKKRFCIDLDSTLVTSPKEGKNYATVEPIRENIEFVKRMSMEGHYIIIHTARRMVTFNHDKKLAEHDARWQVEATLSKFQIPYNELHFGKPYADFYIDDKAIPAFGDLEKATGIYSGIDHAARAHHEVFIGKKTVTKKGDVGAESEWYSSLPDRIRDVSPRLIKGGEDELSLQRVDGVSLAQLYVRGMLTEDHLGGLLSVLSRIHGEAHSKNAGEARFLWHGKLRDRESKHREWYHALFSKAGISRSTAEDLLRKVNTMLLDEDEQGISLMHGDPVFSNALITLDGSTKLIDPRGKIAGERSTAGTELYDYCKVLQSIMGYDFDVAGERIDEHTMLRFLETFLQKAPKADYKTRLSSLVISMLPLHSDDEARCLRFLQGTYQRIQEYL